MDKASAESEAKQAADRIQANGHTGSSNYRKDLIMKTVLTIAAALISTATLLGASSASAASQGYDQYRRVVLGDSTVAAPAAASRTVLVPGSYAQYLINNGSAKSVALTAASAVGEQARFDNVALEAAPAKLTPAQAYAKSIGNDVVASRAEAVTSAE